MIMMQMKRGAYIHPNSKQSWGEMQASKAHKNTEHGYGTHMLY